MLCRSAAGAAISGLVPFAVLQIWPWDWYRLASHASGYVPGCGTVPGVLDLGVTGGLICFAFAAGVSAWLRWSGLGIDPTAAAAMVAAMLVYPLAWFQYDTCLLPVVAWLIAGITATGNRLILWGLVVYLLLRTIPDLMPGPGAGVIVEWLAQYKNWIQVIARGILLGTVAASILNSKISRLKPSSEGASINPG